MNPPCGRAAAAYCVAGNPIQIRIVAVSALAMRGCFALFPQSFSLSPSPLDLARLHCSCPSRSYITCDFHFLSLFFVLLGQRVFLHGGYTPTLALTELLALDLETADERQRRLHVCISDTDANTRTLGGNDDGV